MSVSWRRDFKQRSFLPPLRHAVGDMGVFVAREAEADEPFPVKLPCCLLQQGHPPTIVLDQVVVSREDVCDATLNGLWRKAESEITDFLTANVRYSHSPGYVLHVGNELGRSDDIRQQPLLKTVFGSKSCHSLHQKCLWI